MDFAPLDRSVERGFVSTLSATWRHKLVFAVTGLLVFGGIATAVLAIRPVYEATTLMVSGQASLEISSPTARQSTESPLTLTRIAESEEVLRQAIASVGPTVLAPPPDPNRASAIDRLRSALFGAEAAQRRATDPIESSLPLARAGLNVRAEPTSGVIRLSFRHRDPTVATNFVNAVAQAFVDRYIALYSRPGAVEFFMNQQRRFEQEVAAASERLERFSTQTGVFAADQQRELLLRRLNELNAALALARNTTADKLGQRQALADQLRRLAPVARSNYVSSLVDSLAGERPAQGARQPDNRTLDERAGDPPLLLVRVYQDSMVSLFRINAELLGAQNAQAQLTEEQSQVVTQLNRLTEVSEEYARLRRAVDQAAANSDINARRMIEEQINAELSAARFSSVRLMQRATVPLEPVFPNYRLAIVAAAVVALMAAVMASVLAHLLARRRAARRA